MTLATTLDNIRVTEVWTALGGTPLRHNRGRAFWRNGDGYNVSLDDRKGCWKDFATDTSGGILDLIQTVLGTDRKGAVQWLSETFALNLDSQPFTSAERSRYAQARIEASQFLEWKEAQLYDLIGWRNFHLEQFHCAIQLILTHSLFHPRADSWATACEQHEARYHALDAQIDDFRAADMETLIRNFRAEGKRVAA